MMELAVTLVIIIIIIIIISVVVGECDSWHVFYRMSIKSWSTGNGLTVFLI